MPALFIESCARIKPILESTESLEGNWLVSYLECHAVGWEGCEKWGRDSFILTDDELRKDVYLRDMSFVWGAFSAIPKEYSEKDILSYKLPELENPYYMGNHIVPQHPLAFLEISVWDASYTYISAHDENVLKPFYTLPYKVIDVEADNQKMNKELCRIQDVLRSIVPNASDVIANEVQWNCWHALFRDKEAEIFDEKLTFEVKKAYETISATGYHFSHSSPIWNPYDQK